MVVDVVIFEASWSAMRIGEILVDKGRPRFPGKSSDGILPYNRGRTSVPSRGLGPSKIAQRIREAGYTCQTISFVQYMTKNQIEQIKQKFIDKNTIVGISSTFSGDEGGHQIAAFMKEFFRDHNHTLIGGPSAHLWSELAAQQGYKFKHVITSFAENKIVDFMHSIKNYGIAKKRTNQWDILSCQHRWHPSSCITEGETLPLETSRGCIFHCKFCRFPMLGKKKGTYLRDMKLIREEMIYNYECFRTTNYILADDTFNDTPEKVEEWCNMIDTLPFEINYVTYLRADLLHRFPHTQELLKNSGLKAAHFGIETLNPKSASIIGKAWSGKHAREYVPHLVNNIWNKEISVSITFVCGLPFDTPQDWNNWNEWAEKHRLSVYFIPLHIQTARRTKKNIEEEGISIFDIEAEKYGYKIINENAVSSQWELNGIKYSDVRKLIDPLNVSNEFYGTTPAFQTIELLSLGFDVETTISTPRYEMYSNPDTWMKCNKFVEKYVQRLLTVT
jgi:hypothetical protein